MAWVTKDAINSIVAEIKSLVMTNTATLGGIKGVSERDETPAVVAQDGRLPWAYVIPIMEGGDHMIMTIDPSTVDHEFPITLVVYYGLNDTELDTALETVRDYGYNAFDIIRRHNAGIIGPQGGLTEADLDVGYWVSVDQIVHFFILKLMFKALL